MSKPPTPSPRDALRAFAPKLIDLTDNVLFGDVWERPGLSKRDRSLIGTQREADDTPAAHLGLGLGD